MRFLKPTSSFRSHFGYQNILFLAAAEIAGDNRQKLGRLRARKVFRAAGNDAHHDQPQLLAPKHCDSHNEFKERYVIRYGNVDNAAAPRNQLFCCRHGAGFVCIGARHL